MLLIGGPARRYGWSDDDTLQRLNTVVQRSPEITQWAATSSRRTPATSTAGLTALAAQVSQVTFTPASDTPRGWVSEALAHASVAWVTEDSVSMIFESLTAGCRVGLLPLPHRPGLGERFLGWGPGRVARGVRQLIERGQVTRYADWVAGQPLCLPPEPVAEAQRIAALVWERWDATHGSPR